MAAFKSNIAGQKEAQEDLRGVENEMSSFLECEQIYSTVFSSDDEETLDDEETMDAAMRAQTVGEKEEERAHVHVHKHMFPSSPCSNKGHETARWLVYCALFPFINTAPRNVAVGCLQQQDSDSQTHAAASHHALEVREVGLEFLDVPLQIQARRG